MFDFTGKVVAITGASSGIGHEIASAFYEAGAKLALCSRSAQQKPPAFVTGELKSGITQVNELARGATLGSFFGSRYDAVPPQPEMTVFFGVRTFWGFFVSTLIVFSSIITDSISSAGAIFSETRYP